MVKHGIDVSNFSGTPTHETLAALVHGLNLSKIVIACQFPFTWDAWYPLADALGLEIEAYRFLYNDSSYTSQTRDALSVINGSNVRRLWLDVELDPEHTAVRPNAVDELTDSLELWPGFTGIYTAEDYWLNQFGNPQMGHTVPLWNAAWVIRDGYTPPPASFEVAFGGWLRSRARQYVGECTSYGLVFGLDAWDE